MPHDSTQIQAIAAGCAFINATPNFIASDPAWQSNSKTQSLPLVGDDLVDQVGSTALHKTLLKLLSATTVSTSTKPTNLTSAEEPNP